MDLSRALADDWIKLDLHLHTLDDTRDALDFSAHQLLERAQALGLAVLAITLHDSVFARAEVFAEAAAMGILLISAAEMRLQGADVVVLNIDAEEAAGLKTFADLRRLRGRRGSAIFTFAPHPFYLIGGSIGGKRLRENIDCFDAIEICHFHKGWFDRNRPARRLAAEFGRPLIATSDAHQLKAFGAHYTAIPRPAELTLENIFAALRAGVVRLTSPAASWFDILETFYFIFVAHPRRQRELERETKRALESRA